MAAPPVSAPPGSVRDVAGVFVRLGLTAFGGPLAHIAAMEDELVARRQWVTPEEFADLVGAANLIPGPNSTELAIHLGYRRAGWPGLLAAGLGFLLPAVLMVWAIAWAYQRLGARIEVAAALAGMQPAVLAVVVQAAWRLRASVVRSHTAAALAAAALVAVLLGVPELHVLLATLFVAALRVWRAEPPARWLATAGLSAFPALTGAATAIVAATGTAPLGPAAIFVSCAKIGSVLFGSGYVLLAFLRAEFGTRLAVLTDAQLLDAIAVGQVTPGPVFSAATFVGYLLAGSAGAWAATAGIFLPAFVGVAVTAPLVRRLRDDPRLAPALDLVNAVSLALMVSVVLGMARAVAAEAGAFAIFLAATVMLLTTRMGAGWVLLLGGLTGLLRLL